MPAETDPPRPDLLLIRPAIEGLIGVLLGWMSIRIAHALCPSGSCSAISVLDFMRLPAGNCLAALGRAKGSLSIMQSAA